MADKSLDILVKLGVIGKEDVKAVNDLMGETGKKTEDAGKSAEISHGSFRKLAHVLGSEIPGGAALMEAGFTSATEPMMGATFLLIAGLEMLKNAIEKINEQEKESLLLAGELADIDATHSKVIEKKQDALEAAAVAEENFHHNLVRNTRDSIAETSKLAAELLKVASANAGGQHEEKKNLAEKQIDEMEQRGVVSHETATAMKMQVDYAYHRNKVMMMMAEEQVQKQIDEGELKAKTGESKKLTGEEAAAAQKYAAANQAKVDNDTKMEEAREKIAKAEEYKKSLRDSGVTEDNITQMQESFAKVSGQDPSKVSLEEQFHYLATSLTGMNVKKVFGEGGDRNLALYEGADIDIASGKHDLAAGRKKRTGLDMAEGDAKSDLDAAHEELKKNRALIQELQTKIATETRTNNLRDHGAINQMGMEGASDVLSGARGVADRLQGGGSATTKEKQQLVDIASRIAGHRVDLQTSVKIIENGANNINVFMTQVSRLTAAFAKVDPAKLRADVDNLIAQMNTAP